MSQEGAKGMAEAGFTYDKILTHYFTGTKVEQADFDLLLNKGYTGTGNV